VWRRTVVLNCGVAGMSAIGTPHHLVDIQNGAPLHWTELTRRPGVAGPSIRAGAGFRGAG
jgi:hypothetical protein